MLLFGVLLRAPIFAGGVMITLHVVRTLDLSYLHAGLVTTAALVCLTVSGPVQGRLLDLYGLRKVVLPSVAIMLACWVVAPFAGYSVLLVLNAVTCLFGFPVFTVCRQGIIAAVPVEQRRPALALDGLATEIAFILGPLLAVAAAGIWPTAWVLFTGQLAFIGLAVLLCVLNPPLRGDSGPAGAVVAARRVWLLPLLALCVMIFATTFTGTGTELSIVVAMREFGVEKAIGAGLAMWGLGSMVGGLLYGAMRQRIPAHVQLGLLGLLTLPLALAEGPISLLALLFVAGLCWAPTITASFDQLCRVVPASAQGEAMGWHGSFMTIGTAVGAAAAGFAADRAGADAAFVMIAAVAVSGAVLGALAGRETAPERAAEVAEPAYEAAKIG